MDIEQAMRAMAPLPESELALAFGLETEAPWPPRLTAADRRAARRVRTELLAPEPWGDGDATTKKRRSEEEKR